MVVSSSVVLVQNGIFSRLTVCAGSVLKIGKPHGLAQPAKTTVTGTGDRRRGCCCCCCWRYLLLSYCPGELIAKEEKGQPNPQPPTGSYVSSRWDWLEKSAAHLVPKLNLVWWRFPRAVGEVFIDPHCAA